MPITYNKFWENIYIEHIDELKLKAKKYPPNYVYEFDSLDELREFDVKSLAVVPMHNNAHVVGVIVIENYKEKTIKIPKIHYDMDIAPHFYFIVQIGAKIKEANKILGNCFVVTIIFSILLTIVVQIFKEPILYTFGASENTIKYALDYINIYSYKYHQYVMLYNSYNSVQFFI